MGKRQLWYFVIYRSREDRTPAGIVVQGFDGTEGHELIWSHRAGGWRYSRGAGGTWMADNHPDLSDKVTREQAEQAAPTATGGQALPDEDTIWWIFQWKGEPPQNED